MGRFEDIKIERLARNIRMVSQIDREIKMIEIVEIDKKGLGE